MAEFTFWEKVFLFLIRYPFSWVLLLENLTFTVYIWVKNLFWVRRVQRNDLSEREAVELRKKRHVDKVGEIQKEVKEWIESEKGKTKMCCGRPAWQMLSFKNPTYKKTMTQIDISKLNSIIELDERNKILTVEPNVSMGQISEILLPLGWTIAVLPELEELTIGGMINGFGIESSSHKYGLFQNTYTSLEIILPNGHIINCSSTENSDIFYALPWSCGTIGFLLSIKLKLVPAKSYVRLQYNPVHSLDDAMKKFEFEAKRTDENQFVEGLMFSSEKGVIMTGNFADNPNPQQINRIGLWFKPWFYKHVESFLSRDKSTGPFVEYIPVRSYYHRHSRSSFWEQQYLFPFGNNIFFRYLCGWLLPMKLQYLKWSSKPWMRNILMKNHMVEDFLIPINRLREFLVFVDNETKIYPVWLCGALQEMRNAADPRGLVDHFDRKCPLYVDVGVYGDTSVNIKDENVSAKIYRMEMCSLKMKGYKALYADAILNKEEFRQMYCHELYDVVREQYGGLEAFPEMYDKVKQGSRK